MSASKEHDKDIDSLYNRIAELENRIESQEQYSRRTSLRFNNVPVPVDVNGKIIHPVDTDNIILDICRNKLNLSIDLNDIGRSHVIGKVKHGKSQVVVRFISYRTRHLVYSNKKPLKEMSVIFLTKFRTSLVKKLASMKSDKLINAYWTADGRLLVKQSENGRKHIINDFQDIYDLERLIRD